MSVKVDISDITRTSFDFAFVPTRDEQFGLSANRSIWIFRQSGREHVVGGHGTPDALEREFTHRLGHDDIFDCHQHAGADEYLSRELLSPKNSHINSRIFPR
jgi:hypothetical protein